MQLKDMNLNGADVLDLALEKIEKLSKNQYFKDMLFKNDLEKKFNLASKSGAEAAQVFFSNRIMSHIPNLMRYAKAELAEYFSFVNGVSEEEYLKDMTVGNLYDDIYGMISDKVFLNFFSSFTKAEETT